MKGITASAGLLLYTPQPKSFPSGMEPLRILSRSNLTHVVPDAILDRFSFPTCHGSWVAKKILQLVKVVWSEATDMRDSWLGEA